MKKQAGFTMVELLVALAITLIVMTATLAAFNDALQANQGVTAMADMTDNLRAGMNMIVRDLVQAGQGIPTGGIPIPSGAGGTPINRPSPPTAVPAYTFPAAATALPVITTGAFLGPLVTSPDAPQNAATDIITILYADNTLPLNQRPINDTAPPPPTAPCNGTISASGNTMTVDKTCTDIAAGNNPIRTGDLIMFSNAQGNALQVVTSVIGQQVNFATKDVFNLNQRTDPQGTIQQIQAPPASGNYPPTTATRIWMITYYVDTVTDPARTRLVRQVNFNAPQPVAEIIENMQFTYNFVDGVTNPSNQKNVPPGFSENQIRAVNLFLAARSNAPFSKTGRYFRNNFATQVSLRSLAYVNRYR